MRLPTKKEIIPPAEGWKEKTLYLVEMSYLAAEPIRQAYLCVRVLNGEDGGPDHYSGVWYGSYDVPAAFGGVHYLKVIKVLHEEST